MTSMTLPLALSPSSSNPPIPWLQTVDLLLMSMRKQLITCILYFFWFHYTGLLWKHLLAVKATRKLLRTMTCLCCSIEHTTNGRGMTVSIRREVVYCGRGGELKVGRPVFIYKYPYSRVLSCKLCRNWSEQGCVYGFKRQIRKYNPEESVATQMSHEWVP